MLPLLVGLLISWTTAILAFWIQPKPIVLIPYLIVNPLLFALPRIVRFVVPVIRRRVDETWLCTVEMLGAMIILLNAPGSLILHDLGIQYDRFLHFSVGTLVFLLAVSVVAAFRGAKRLNAKTIWTSVAIVFVGLFCFELFQFSIDQIFGTHLFHDEAQLIVRDVTEDIIFGSLGLILASVILVRSKRAWRFFVERGIRPDVTP